jgi:hypothetical protein
MFADQFAHAIRHLTAQQGDQRPFLYGHIASYDPKLHRVRCIIPSMTDQDGTPLLSPWMPMGTLAASGGGAGIQIIYQGGASVSNPNAGEQVMIAMFDRNRGVAAVPAVFFHSTNPPPSTNLPTTDDGYSSAASPVAPNDIIISAPSATAGGANSFIRIRQNGAIETWCAGPMTANVIGDVTINNSGNVNVTTKGTVSVIADGDATTTTKGSATISAQSGNINLDTPQVNCSGGIVAAGDVKGGGISLVTHAHSE